MMSTATATAVAPSSTINPQQTTKAGEKPADSDQPPPSTASTTAASHSDPPTSAASGSTAPTSAAADPTTATDMAAFMQLRAEIPPAPQIRHGRKRKSPATALNDQQQQPHTPPVPQAQLQQQAPDTPEQQQQQQQQQNGNEQQQQGESPPQTVHAMPPQHLYAGLPPPSGSVYPANYHYYAPPPGEYPNGMMPPPGLIHAVPHPLGVPAPPPAQQGQGQENAAPDGVQNPRVLSSSKRAEQNRKAQRAFRERRDQHVRQLEQRSHLLDAALASADEANRRWEECRVLVDQLRIENTALRTALQQAHGQVTALGGTIAETTVSVGGDGKAVEDS